MCVRTIFAVVLMSLALAGIQVESPAEQRYSVLETAGLDAQSEEMLFDYLLDAVRVCDEKRARTVAEFSVGEEWLEWGEKARSEMHRAVGGFPKRTPLNARVTGVLDRDGYTVEKLIYESRPGFLVTANLYLPKNGEPPYPAVLSPCGHTSNGKAGEMYQLVYISLAKLGFVVLAYDPVGQGERNEYWDTVTDKAILQPGTMQHCQVGNQCYLTGTNLAQYRIWDGIRSIDYLCSRDEVDPERIGVAGNSGGGTLTTYIVAVDDRVQAAMPSCYVTTLARRVATRGTADAEQNFVGQFPNMLDHADMLLAFAPKPLMIACATQDFFPIEGTREAYECLARAYDALGAREKVGITETDEKHGWTIELRNAGYGWFNRWLKGGTAEVVESPDLEVEPDANLLCTSEGQVAYLGSRTVFDLNLEYAEKTRPQRDHAAILSGLDQWQNDMRRTTLDLLNIPDDWNEPGELHSVDRRVVDGISVEQLYVTTEPGILVPALLFKRPNVHIGMPLVVYVDEQGKSEESAPEGLYRRLVRAGCAVLAVDPRGIGETKSPARGRGGYYGYYGIEADFTYTSFMLDRPLLGMRVYDVLRTTAAVENRLRPSTILCAGTGFAAPIALFAAAVDESIDGALCRSGPVSYFSIIGSKHHKWHVNCFVPDVVRHLDLPDLAALVAPRALFIVEPLDGEKEGVSGAEAREMYALAERICRQAGTAENFRLSADGSDDTLVELVASWCRQNR